jgi:serine/threonine protein kinase
MPFSPGQTITLRTESKLIQYTVLKLFEPITKSVVLLVRESDADETSTPVVMKMYDPRYLDERSPPKVTAYWVNRPWTLEHEKAAAEIRDAVERGDIENPLADEDVLYPDLEEEEGDQVSSPEDLERGAVLWEESYYRSYRNLYTYELKAYRMLEDLQGTSLPKLYQWGTHVPDEERGLEPWAIVIEYIPGYNLENIPAEFLVPSLFQPLIDDIDSFTTRGLAHCDISFTNVLFTPREHPTRGVVIDFGNAGFRELSGDMTEEQWKQGVAIAGDRSEIRWYLKDRGVKGIPPCRLWENEPLYFNQ